MSKSKSQGFTKGELVRFQITLMYRPNGTNNPLQPYEGGRIITGNRLAGQATQTFSFDNLDPNYYCILIQTYNGCYNDDFPLFCCVPTKIHWLETVKEPINCLANGSLSIRLGAEVVGQYRVTLLWKANAGLPDSDLKPFEGGRIVEGNRLAGQATTIVTFNNLPPNYYCILIQTYNGCYTNDMILHCLPPPTICTYTQGAYGSEGGKMSDGLGKNDYSTKGLLNLLLTNPLIIGANGRFVKITTAQEVLDFLPNGGPSFAFTHNGTLDIDNVLSHYNVKKGGSLLAQTITLGLNLRIGNKLLGSIPLTGLVNASIINALSDKTVGGLYNLANLVLGGGAVPAGLDLSSISDAVTAINEYFDECVVYRGPVEQNSARLNNNTPTEVVTNNKSVTINVSPNPFRNNVRFVVESKISGQGILEVYNMAGVKLANAFKGYVMSGKGQVIEYRGPFSTSGLVYVFRVNGQQQATGKLVAAK